MIKRLHRAAGAEPSSAGNAKWEWRNVAIAGLVTCGYALAGGLLLFWAEHLHGPGRVAIGAVGWVGIAMAALIVFWALVIALGWGTVAATARVSPSVLQWSVWALTAIAAGALCGGLTYGVGLANLASGPVLLAAVWIVLARFPDVPKRVQRRSTAFVAILAVVATLVGLTVLV